MKCSFVKLQHVLSRPVWRNVKSYLEKQKKWRRRRQLQHRFCICKYVIVKSFRIPIIAVLPEALYCTRLKHPMFFFLLQI